MVVALIVATAACSSLAPTLSPSATPSLGPSASPQPTVEPTATPRLTSIPIPLDEELLGRRFSVLIVGYDSSLSRRNGGNDDRNTDALMVISISADRSRIAVVSLPRDTVDVPLANGTTYRRKVNAIADELGIEALRGGMATLLGIPIDRYMAVDMDDFTWLVDVVGGIDIEVPARISDPVVHLSLDVGLTHMDGSTALNYARTRVDSDYGRAARQQLVMVALAREWLTPGLGALIGSVRWLGSLETDIPLREIPTLLEIGRRSASAEVAALVLRPPQFSLFVGTEPNSNRGWVMIPDLAAIRAAVGALVAD
jgi:LCP family protein required for cell wall assembly